MNNTKDNVLILMAVFNGTKVIEEQLQSILNQTHPSLHIIISDNCSTDSTLLILDKIKQAHPDKITVLTSDRNQGVIGNFAKLIQYADADYIMFSDCDDVWLPHKVEWTLNEMRALEKSKGFLKPLLVHTDLIVADKDLNPIHRSFWEFSHYFPKRHVQLNRQLVQNVITGCTVMINRSLLEMSRPLPDGIIMHDWWLGLVAFAFGSVGIVNAPTMLYRQHGANDTGAKQYGLIPYFKRRFKKKGETKPPSTYAQAKLFLELYKNQLTTKQMKSIQDFIRKEKSGFFSRFYITARHGFYKHGFLRNIKEMLF